MNNNTFFKPTPMYKEFMILDLIEKDSRITQRMMSSKLGVAVSMINQYLDEYEENGYIRRKYLSTKNVEYFITKKGSQRKNFLNISYLNAAQKVYRSAKENIVLFLNSLIERGFKNILLYGAGEVAEILLQVMSTERDLEIEVVGVTDDDALKQGSALFGHLITSFEQTQTIDYDGILVSSFTHHQIIFEKLITEDIDKHKIIGLF